MIITTFLLLALIRNCNMLQIKRSTIDTILTDNLTDCRNLSGIKSPASDMCRCNEATSTFMSLNNSVAGCKKPTDLSCNGVGLVLNRTATGIILRPKLTSKRSNCNYISSIHTWNFIDGTGAWIDISDFTEGMLTLEENSVLLIKGTFFRSLEGHLIMVKFGCEERCTLVKFEGKLEYPFDISKFNATHITNKQREFTLVELIVIIAVPSVVAIVILLSVCCVYRQRICRRQVMTKRDSTCSKAKMTMGFDNEFTMNNDPWSPWYDIYKLAEIRRNYLRKPSGDSFHIPTIKGYTKERNLRREENIYEMNLAYESSSSRPHSRFSCVFPDNPYKESAT